MNARFVASLIALAVLAGTARADVSNEVYSDIKGVIVELVTSEVATSIVPEIACRGGHAEYNVEPPIPGATQAPLPASVVVIGALHYRLTILDHFPRTLQALYSRQFGGLKTALLSEVADLAGYRLYIALRDRDAVKSISSFTKNIRQQELDRFGVLKVGGYPEPKTVSETTYAALANCHRPVKARFDEGAFGGPRQTPLEVECSRSSRNPIACDLALGLRSMLVGDKDSAKRTVTHAAAQIVSEVIASKLGLASSGGLEARIAGMITSLGEGNVPSDLLQWLSNEIAPFTVRYTTAAVRATELAAEVARVANAIHEIEQPLRQLAAEWRVVAGGKAGLDVSAFVDHILGVSGGLRALCTKVAGGATCTESNTVASVLKPGGLMWPLVQAASRGDIRTVTHAVISSVFSSVPNRASCAGTEDNICHKDVYQRFTTSLALYVIDIADGSSTAETTRAAFRSAAEEVIRSIQPRGYTRSWGANILSPDFALRFSWNGGYVNEDGSSFRYVASLPFAVLRPPIWYTERTYSAVHVSFFDPLAPLSELALRPNSVDFAGEGWLLLNAVAPRVDVVVGKPSLSSHLILGLGASLRLVVPYETTQPSDGRRSFVYRPLWRDERSWSNSIEVGFVVKYML